MKESCNQQACQSISSKTDKMILFILPQTTKNPTDKPSVHSSQQPTMIPFKLPSWHPSQSFTAKPLLPTQTQTGKKNCDIQHSRVLFLVLPQYKLTCILGLILAYVG